LLPLCTLPLGAGRLSSLLPSSIHSHPLSIHSTLSLLHRDLFNMEPQASTPQSDQEPKSSSQSLPQVDNVVVSSSSLTSIGISPAMEMESEEEFYAEDMVISSPGCV
ncbi:hypothetical protein PENTCL1PPCAC_30711, partial [Pristionchus entomophagus]